MRPTEEPIATRELSNWSDFSRSVRHYVTPNSRHIFDCVWKTIPTFRPLERVLGNRDIGFNDSTPKLHSIFTPYIFGSIHGQYRDPYRVTFLHSEHILASFARFTS